MNSDSNNFQENIGDENYVPDDSVPLPTTDLAEDLSADVHNSTQTVPSHLYIGNRTKVTMGYGMDKCSHSSTSGLHNMEKTGKLKADVKSIGDPDSVDPTPLKAPVDVYKAPVDALDAPLSDEDSMDLPVEIRKITVESDYTSPMEVREQGENVVINAGGLDDSITVRSTAKNGVANEIPIKMKFLDGILTHLTDASEYDYPGYGKNLNLVVHTKSYTLVTVTDTVYGSSPVTNYPNMMKAATSGQTTAVYYWRNGLYVGTVEPDDEVADVVHVDYWQDDT